MTYRNDDQPETLPDKWSIPFDLGFSVIPVEPRGKKPMGEWKRFMTRAADRATVAHWAANNNCNVGIITGRVSGAIILDFDNPDAEAEARRRGLPETVTVKTNRGRHYYFAYTDQPIRKPREFPDGMDILSDRKFVVAPGSVHPNGTVYEWENDPQVYPLADLPEWLLGSAENEPQDARGDGDDDEGPIITPTIMADLTSALQNISASVDRETWVNLGMALATLPKEMGHDLWHQWSASCPDKYDRAEAERVWQSLDPHSMGHRFIFAEATRRGWVNPAKGKKPAANNVAGHNTRRILPGPKELKPTEFVLDGFVPTGVSVIAGAWGAGKSTCLIPLLASAAHIAPEAWGFWPAIRRKVIWVTEAPEQATDTIYSLSEADGAAPWDDIWEWFILFRAHRQEADDLAQMLKAVVAEHTYSLDNGFMVHPVIALDTSAANFELENESDNSEVSRAIATLKQSLPGVSIVVIGHTPKALRRADFNDATFRGAGAWEADAVATYFLIYDAPTDTRYLAIRKCRFNPNYREVEFDHEGGSKIIATPWGLPQGKSYLHGVPTKSSGEARMAARQDALEERRDEASARRDREILEAVTRIIDNTAGHPSRKAISEQAGGMRAQVLAAIKRLVEVEALVEHKIDRAHFGSDWNGPAPKILLPVEMPLEAYLAMRSGDQNQSGSK